MCDEQVAWAVEADVDFIVAETIAFHGEAELALASITTIPARMMGIGHRVGTLETGKDCDLIVTDGDLLHYQGIWAADPMRHKPVAAGQSRKG